MQDNYFYLLNLGASIKRAPKTVHKKSYDTLLTNIGVKQKQAHTI